MTDKDLRSLSDISTPTPSEAAKKQALDNAIAAFAQHSVRFAETEKKNTENVQGKSGVGRLIHVLTEKLWVMMMKKRMIQGLAFASVLIVAGLVYLDMPMTLGVDETFSQGGALPMETSPVSPSSPQVVQKSRSAPTITYGGSRDATVAWTEQEALPGGMVMRNDNAAGAASLRKPFALKDGLAASPYLLSEDVYTPQPQYEGRDKFENIEINPIKLVAEEPVSTFSTDVDTAAYAFIRRQLNNGVLPQKDAVRVEELINYFDYDYPLPESAEVPFKPTVAVYPSPWNKNTKLVHIGIKGHDIIPAEKPRSNLVFLLDVSGSMSSQDKLPLLKNAFRMMVENMDAEDTVSIVTYAGRSATVLEPTKVADKHKILTALESLNSGGSTAGAGGIKRAYELAEANFDKEGVNRVILATDGDFNVGITDRDELKGYIERKRDSGIFLSVLGFGQGNYNDALMQTLAQNGNGNAAYIDNLNEARKVLVEEAGSTLFTIAKDVKIQVEFNPAMVSEYRLIGYETRMLKREDFNNDKVDAGDIGSGHTVTAIYEITPVGSPKMVDDLRYGKKEDIKQAAGGSEYAFLKMRYKLPKENTSKLIELPITKALEKGSVSEASADVRFAAAVAGFGQLLRGGKYLTDFDYDDVIALANGAKGADEFGYRAEFVNLVRLAKASKAM